MADQPTPPAEGTDSEDLVGQVVAERYAVVRALARGSMGSVYLAEQRPLGRIVALKVIDLAALRVKEEGEDSSNFERRFLREAAVLAKLSHPNTVRVFDFGVWRERSFLVMEYVEGTTLRQLIRAEGPLEPLRAVRIAEQICGALIEAHEQGIVHRDLKPANILVTRGRGDDRELVKVVDFGLVKEMNDAVNMTGGSMMLGTPMYMSPEQIRGKPLDGRSDVYALGVVLYLALTQRAPFDGTQVASTLMAHLSDPPLPIQQALPGQTLLPQLAWAVMRCLEKDRDQRFASALELRKALSICEQALRDEPEALASELSLVNGRLLVEGEVRPPSATQTHPSGPVRVMQPPRRRSAWPLVLLGILAAMLLAVTLGFVVVRGARALRQPPPPIVQPAPPPKTLEQALGDAAVAPEPAPAPAITIEPASPPEPEPQPQPEPSPAPKPVAKPTKPAPKPAPTAAAPQPAAPNPKPAAPSPKPAGSNDLIDPWSTP